MIAPVIGRRVGGAARLPVPCLLGALVLPAGLISSLLVPAPCAAQQRPARPHPAPIPPFRGPSEAEHVALPEGLQQGSAAAPTTRPASAGPPGGPAAAPAASEEDQAGFAALPAVALPPPPPVGFDWSVIATLRSHWALWAHRFADNPFAKARQSADLAVRYVKGPFRLALQGHAEYDFAYLYHRDSYDAPTLNAYEGKVFAREAIAELTGGRFAITFGYQVLAWGTANLLPTLDVVNPRDLREVGMADLGDLRLPVLSTRVGASLGGHRLEVMMIHLPDFGLRTPPNGPFSNLVGIFPVDYLSGKDYQDTTPAFNQQFLMRWMYGGHNVDVALYAASVLDQAGLLPATTARPPANQSVLSLDHPRYTLLGHSGAWSLRSWLFKWEVAFELQRPFNTGPMPIGAVSLYRANPMLGVSYTGLRDLDLSLEVSKGWLLSNRDDPLLYPADRLLWALRASYRLLRDRLEFSAFGTVLGLQAEQGFLIRGEVSYVALDGLKFHLGYITYHSGSVLGPLTGLDNHDRIYFGLSWSMQLL